MPREKMMSGTERSQEPAKKERERERERERETETERERERERERETDRQTDRQRGEHARRSRNDGTSNVSATFRKIRRASLDWYLRAPRYICHICM